MNNKKGFTLIEVLIATGIMVPALVMLVYGIIQCTMLTETARNIDIALTAAQQKLEEITNSDLNNIVSNYDGHAFEIAGLASSPAGAGLVAVAGITTNELYEVMVTIRWQQRGGRQMLRTLRTTLVNK